MNSKSYIVIGLAALVAFTGGFLLANSINRTESDALRAEVDSLKAAKAASNSNTESLNLSNEEIDAKIAEADQKPDDLKYQKSLGVALYRYGAMKQDVTIVEKAIRLLDRANSLDGKDADILMALGNSHFDIGYFRKENPAFEKARDYYQKALALKPKDGALRTDLALTYFLQEPPDLPNAAKEFEVAIADDPKNERGMQYYIQTLVKQGDSTKANEVLTKLRELNPQSKALPELTSLINSASNANIK
jgi:tetratricopeptide (TPR) repeat protein